MVARLYRQEQQRRQKAQQLEDEARQVQLDLATSRGGSKVDHKAQQERWQKQEQKKQEKLKEARDQKAKEVRACVCSFVRCWAVCLKTPGVLFDVSSKLLELRHSTFIQFFPSFSLQHSALCLLL